MQCLSPISIPRPNGQGARDRITVPCSKCAACLQSKRLDWSFRLSEELKTASSAYFLTLTYSDENLYYNENQIASVNKKDVQDFFKRLRHKTKNKIKYYVVAEYGTNTHRPHYHAIIFNIDPNKFLAQNYINVAWQKGGIYIGSVSLASINYVTKYCINKEDIPENADKTFSLMSKRPAIGKNYLDRNYEFHDDLRHFYVVNESGFKQRLPRYYKEKLYSKESIEVHSTYYQKKYEEITDYELDFQKKEQYQKRIEQKSKSLKI